MSMPCQHSFQQIQCRLYFSKHTTVSIVSQNSFHPPNRNFDYFQKFAIRPLTAVVLPYQIRVVP
jgi:hypothetical protein